MFISLFRSTAHALISGDKNDEKFISSRRFIKCYEVIAKSDINAKGTVNRFRPLSDGIRYWITLITFFWRGNEQKTSNGERIGVSWRSGTSPKYWNIGKYKFMQPLLFIGCIRCFGLRSSGQFYRIDCILLRYNFVDSPIVRSRWRIGRYNDLHLLVNKSALYLPLDGNILRHIHDEVTLHGKLK